MRWFISAAALGLVLVAPPTSGQEPTPQPAAAQVAPAQPKKAKLIIQVSGIHSDKGIVNAGLYQSDEGFPGDRTKAFRVERGKIKDGKATVTFENVPFGSYAFGLYHDENNDGELERTWIGKPEEGICTSNNAEKKDLPPKFEKARFTVDGAEKTLNVVMTYLD
jgi:uncharacterized protein (DUF2141 family)